MIMPPVFLSYAFFNNGRNSIQANVRIQLGARNQGVEKQQKKQEKYEKVLAIFPDLW